MTGLIQDVHYGLRLLRRNPGFTAAAVLSLALGIGANTTIFSMFDAVLLRSFGAQESLRLVNVFTSRRGHLNGRSSFPNFEDVRDPAGAFSAVLARSYWPVSVRGDFKPEVVLGNIVSTNYFEVLGVQPPLGRGFLPEEGAVQGASPVAVLSHRLWRRSFGGDPGIVGRTVRINNYPFTVIGVAPEGFAGIMAGFASDVWVPITMIARVVGVEISLGERGSGWLDIVGRLKDGVEPGQAQEALNGLATRLQEKYPRSNRNVGFTAVAGRPSRFPIAELGRGVTTIFPILLGVVGIVLLIACSNVAHLMLARGVMRQQEIGMRLALGAGRGRILRQLLTESLLLSFMAGAASLLLAAWLIELFTTIRPPSPIPVAIDLRLDSTVLAFTFLLSLFTGIFFGLMPALRASRLSPQAALRERASSHGWRRGRSRAQS
jgi:predicted permease